MAARMDSIAYVSNDAPLQPMGEQLVIVRHIQQIVEDARIPQINPR